MSHNSVSQSVTVRSRKISLWAQTEKVLFLMGGGVQINNGNVIPWRARHAQVCLHLAYILVMTVFPTPIFFSLLQVHNLTISSTWGVSEQNSSTALTRTPLCKCRLQRGTEKRQKTSIISLDTPLTQRQEVEAWVMRCKKHTRAPMYS